MTASPTAISTLTCPPTWSVLAARLAAAERPATTTRAVSLRVPLVQDGQWFWDLVGEVELEEAADAPQTDDQAVWGIVAVPAALVVQVGLTYLLHLSVPDILLVLELLVACVVAARVDAIRLRAVGLDAPHPLTAVVPPAYLFRRSQVTNDLRIPLWWFVVAAAATFAYALVDARLAPVALPSQAVESTLYEQLFEGQLPLDAETGTIACPGFSVRWVGQEFRCTGHDKTRSIPLEVSVLDRRGALTWQALEPAP